MKVLGQEQCDIIMIVAWPLVVDDVVADVVSDDIT